MWIQFSSGFLVNKLLDFIQEMLHPEDSDGVFLFWAKELLGAMLILAFFWILSQLAVMALNKWGKKLASATATDLDDRLLHCIIPYIYRLFMTGGVYFAVRTLPLGEKLMLAASGLLYVILVTIIFTLVYHAMDELLKWYVAGQKELNSGAMARQMIPVVEKLASLFLLGTALIIILKHFNVDIFSLVTALGIGSLAIGMAAKDTLAHMISGFTLMVDRPFRIGDRIQLSGGQLGDVLDIGLRSTKIKTLDNQLLIIPNSDLCNTMLTNQAFPNSKVKGRINLGIGYNSDVDDVKKLLVKIALETEGVLAEPLPEAFFVSFGDSALNMSLFFWVEEYATLITITDRVNSRIISIFRQKTIEIPYPVKTVILEQHKN